MKDAESTFELLLKGLRDAEPQPGIEHRLLETLQTRATLASVPFWAKLWPQALPAFALWLAIALAVTVALFVSTLHQRSRLPADSSHAPTLTARETGPAEAITPKVPIPAQRPASRVWSKHAPPVTPVRALPAASVVAPPLPLTEQEKLLLRLTRRRKPEDMAILDPAGQAAQSAEANQQFQQFFGINATEMRNQIE